MKYAHVFYLLGKNVKSHLCILSFNKKLANAKNSTSLCSGKFDRNCSQFYIILRKQGKSFLAEKWLNPQRCLTFRCDPACQMHLVLSGISNLLWLVPQSGVPCFTKCPIRECLVANTAPIWSGLFYRVTQSSLSFFT